MSDKNTDYKRWSKEVDMKDGSHKRIEVECVKNGYIIEVTTYQVNNDGERDFDMSHNIDRYISKEKPEDVIKNMGKPDLSMFSKDMEMLNNMEDV